MGKLLDSWYALLNGAVTYSGKSVKVYKESVPLDSDPSATRSEHYILLRAEGESDNSNKTAFATDSIMIVDIVTRFNNSVDRSVVENIDGQVTALVLPTQQTGLGSQSGMQILNVKRESTTYLTETNIEKYYRKVSRYNTRILQTS